MSMANEKAPLLEHIGGGGAVVTEQPLAGSQGVVPAFQPVPQHVSHHSIFDHLMLTTHTSLTRVIHGVLYHFMLLRNDRTF